MRLSWKYVEAREMESNNGHCQVDLVFSSDSPPSDPKSQPVLIVGQAVYLNKIEYNQIQHKLEPRVSKEVRADICECPLVLLNPCFYHVNASCLLIILKLITYF